MAEANPVRPPARLNLHRYQTYQHVCKNLRYHKVALPLASTPQKILRPKTPIPLGTVCFAAARDRPTKPSKRMSRAKRRSGSPVVHLSQSLDPMFSQCRWHLAKHHGLVLVGQYFLDDLELEIDIFLAEVAVEYIHGLFRPPR